MRTSYEEKLAGKEWSTIRFCFRWNFQSAHAKEINAAIAKGQLISKQNCQAVTSSKKRTKDFCPGSLLLQG